MKISVSAVFLLTAFAAFGLSPVQAPLPPVNWEARADERFTPPVEEVVIALSRHDSSVDDEKIREYWQAWGPEAYEYVVALRDQPRWAAFDRAFLRIAYLCPHPEGQRQLAAHVKKLADDCAAAVNDRGPCSDFSTSLGYFVNYQADGVDALLQDLAQHSSQDVRASVCSYLLRPDHRDTETALAIINELAEGDESARMRAASLLTQLDTPDACERAVEVAATVSEANADNIRQRCEWQQSQLRAQEPMRVVLEQEK